jgi:hypothetical protein
MRLETQELGPAHHGRTRLTACNSDPSDGAGFTEVFVTEGVIKLELHQLLK